MPKLRQVYRKKQRLFGVLKLSSKKVESLVKLRDAFTMVAEALNEYIDTLAPREIREEKIIVNEEIFSILKFEPQEGAKLGSFEVAYKTNNPADKWTEAFNILRSSSATIQERYHSKSYQFSYWLYGEDKIYRQKRKEAAL